ncbi:MAG: SCO family protein [Gemmataceae bacterium]|nr:SCO family protein [Gemmataceae bacterium]
MRTTLLLPLILIASMATVAHAQPLPRELAELQFEQKLGERVPLDLRFVDDLSRDVSLGQLIGDRPTILMLGYQRCPRLCAVLLKNVVGSLAKVPFNVGSEVNVIHVSIDPKEDASLGPAVKSACIEEYGRPSSIEGWHFLRNDEQAVRKLTDSVGFPYQWDSAKGEFAHPSGVIVLAPDGTVARYLFGLDFSPRDLRLAIAEASQGKVSAPAEKALLLTCMSYDPVLGKYGIAVLKIMRAGALLTVALIGLYLANVWRSAQAPG